MQETPEVVYDLQTSFDNLDKRILVAGSTGVYMTEMLFTHPFEVIRTQIQTSQTVRLSSTRTLLLALKDSYGRRTDVFILRLRELTDSTLGLLNRDLEAQSQPRRY